MRNKFSPILLIILVIILLVSGIALLSLKQKNTPNKRNFIALGSSFTKANNLSIQLTGDHPEYSFATGTKIDSLYSYLKSKGENLEFKNLAESGANSQKVLAQQVPNAVSFQPKYVAIGIMTDILEEEKPVKFKQNLIQIAKQLKNPDTIVLIGTNPNLVLMRTASFPSCSEDKLNLGIAKLTEEKIKLFNQVISEVANEYRLILVDNFKTLGPAEVSDYDCLHPNIEGQKKLAKSWITALESRR